MRQQVAVLDLGPVLAPAQGQDEAVEADLVLHVQAGLLHRVVPLGGQGRHAVGVVVGGVVQVDDLGVVEVVALVATGELAVVHAAQQGVLQRPGAERALQVVIDAVGGVVLAPVQLGAGGAGIVDHAVGIGDEAVQVEAAVAIVDVDVACTLTKLQVVVEHVRQVVAEHLLVAGVGVPVAVAQEHVAVDMLAAAVAIQRADDRQRLIVRRALVALDLCVGGELGLLVWRPGQARRDQRARLVGMLDLLVAALGQAHQAVAQGLVGVQRTAHIEGTLDPVIAAIAELDLMMVLDGRALGHQVDHAARLVLAVQHRSRALEHFDAFKQVGVDLRRAAQAAGIRQVGAIQVQQGRRKAAAADLVGDGVAVGVAVGTQPRRIAQRLGQVASALGLHLGGGDHVDCLGDFEDRRVGLGGRGAAGGHVTFHRAARVFQAGAIDGGGRQVERGAIAQRVQAPGAAAGAAQPQASAGQRLARGLFGSEITAYRSGTLALQQRRAYRQGVPAFARDTAERLAQRPGRQVETVHGTAGRDGVVGLRRHRRQRAKGDGQGQQPWAESHV